MPTPRPINFILASSDHGTMIVNRNDYRMVDKTNGYGLGFQILNTSSFDYNEIQFALVLLRSRRRNYGDGVVGIDCGANIGVHTIEWGKMMHGWGRVIAFEAQEKVYYAMAGNVAINNCLNVTALFAAVGAKDGEITIPTPDYNVPASFGSLELRQREKTEFIGQNIDYSEKAGTKVSLMAIDSFKLDRVDLIKIDVEGMEIDVMEGAAKTIKRCKPIIVAEIIKTDKAKLQTMLTDQGYKCFPLGINILAVHESDPVLNNIQFDGKALSLSE